MDRDQVAMKHIIDFDSVASGLDSFDYTSENYDYDTEYDIALVMTPAWGILFPPYNIAKITGHLRQNGIKVFVQDANIGAYHILKNTKYHDAFAGDKYWMWIDEAVWHEKLLPYLEDYFIYVAETISKINTKVIGFSLYNTNKIAVYWFINYLQFFCKDKIIVLGGPEIWYSIPTWENIDYVFKGESENSLLYFLKDKSYVKKEDKAELIGSWYKKKDNLVLNEIGYPDYSDYNFDLYTHSQGISSEVSRGCVAKCSFCTETHFWKFRFRTNNDVVEELIKQKEKQELKRVWFVDSLVNGNLKELERIAQRLIDEKVDISWNGYARCHELADKRHFQLLVDSGCTGLSFGIESGSNKILEVMNKKVSVETCYQNLKDSSSVRSVFDPDRKIFIHINWIVGYAMEEKIDSMQSLAMLYNIRNYAHGISPGATLGVAKGAYLGDRPADYNISETESMYGSWVDNDYKVAKQQRSLRLVQTVIILDIIEKVLINTTLENNQHRSDLDPMWQINFEEFTNLDFIDIKDDFNLNFFSEDESPILDKSMIQPNFNFNNSYWCNTLANEWMGFLIILNYIFKNWSFTINFNEEDFIRIFGTHIGIPYSFNLTANNLDGVIKFNLSHKLESRIVNNEKLFSNISTPFLIFDNELSYEYTPDHLSSHI